MPRQSKGLRDLGEKFTSEVRTVHTTDGKAYPVRFNLETGRFSQPAGPVTTRLREQLNSSPLYLICICTFLPTSRYLVYTFSSSFRVEKMSRECLDKDNINLCAVSLELNRLSLSLSQTGPKACTLTCNLTQHWTFTDRKLNLKLYNQWGFFTFAVETNIIDSRFLTSLCDLRA